MVDFPHVERLCRDCQERPSLHKHSICMRCKVARARKRRTPQRLAKLAERARRVRAKDPQKYRDEANAYIREKRKVNPFLTRCQKYKISLEKLQTMLELQNSACGICEQSLTLSSSQTDHDHSCCSGQYSCGKCVRGLLCGPCNTSLGHLEKKGFMLKALYYLGRFK